MLLWLVVLATAGVGIWALRGVVVQPGSDGYHHTLFAQLIAEGGRLPTTLAPITSVLTFTYHFGYHAFVAVIQWMTGISVVALVPLLAQILKALAALAVAFLVEAIGERRSGGVVAAAVTGLVCVFPAYYVNWGRNTQVTGLLLLAVLLGVVWLWCAGRPHWSTSGFIALLAVGLALAHYRVTLIAALGCTLIILTQGWQARWEWAQWRLRLRHCAAMVGAALLLMGPWVWQVWSVQRVGHPASIPVPGASFYRLDRLGGLVLNYPTNWPLLLVTAVATAWGLWKRVLGIWVMTAWALLLYGLSQPWAASQYMDTITVITSAFVPGSVVIGLAAGAWMAQGPSHPPWRHWLVGGMTVLLSLLGATAISRIVENGSPYVRVEDLGAVQWVRENTDEDALFMVNTYAFDFAPQFIIGSDAGGWLPVLSKRRVITAPMTYSIERNALEGYPQHLQELSALSPDLAAPTAVARLRAEGITHVFVGLVGGPIAVDKLLASPDFRLEYQEGPVYVFRVLPQEFEEQSAASAQEGDQ